MLSFIIPPDHVWRHFSGSDTSGSIFYAKTPSEFLTYAATEFPDVFRQAHTDPLDGRKRLSFKAGHDIGLCNVIAFDDLTSDEAKLITEEERDGTIVKVFYTDKQFPTREFQIILGSDNTVITMFPGPMAPPLPKNGEFSAFWDSHIFIKSKP